VDKIELTMDADLQEQANAIEFGQADLVELQASQCATSLSAAYELLPAIQ